MIYVYRCKQCKNDFEVKQKITETTPTYVCTTCGDVCNKVLQPSNFICPSAYGRVVKKINHDPDWVKTRQRERWD